MNEQQSKKVLVVEDSKTISMVLSLKLKAAGFETETAFDGNEALVKINNENFDLILLDLIMPKMDGFEVLEKLKEQNYNKPIIVTSNLGQEEDQRRAKELGATKLLSKSDMPVAQIVEHIKEMLNTNE